LLPFYSHLNIPFPKEEDNFFKFFTGGKNNQRQHFHQNAASKFQFSV
jgi:hypothetical protein